MTNAKGEYTRSELLKKPGTWLAAGMLAFGVFAPLAAELTGFLPAGVAIPMAFLAGFYVRQYAPKVIVEW